MNGKPQYFMLPIKFRAKPFVARYLIENVPALKVDRTTSHGKYLLSLLGRNYSAHKKYDLNMERYKSEVILYISQDCMERYAHTLMVEADDNLVVGRLSIHQTMDFNDYIGKIVRLQLQAQVAAYMHFDPNIKRAIEFSRSFLGLLPDEYDDDAIRRDLQRARQTGKKIPRVYKISGQLSDLN